ncbi:MAG: hypothetical protein JWO30_4431 [Fibrobacteres bacterium]|nr:hypothetical protein [Fibrobacterota bacterium]
MKHVLSLSAAVLFLCACAPGPKIDPIAQFRGSIDSLPEAWKEEPVIVLSDSIWLTLQTGEAGNHAQRRQSTWYYINVRNPNLMEQIVLADFENIEGPVSVSASAYYPDGESWRQPSYSVRRERSSEGDYPSTNRFLSGFTLPRYLKGTVIRLDVTRDYTRPEFLKTELLRGDYPCLAKTLILSTPPGSDLRIGLENPEGIPLDSARSASETGSLFSVTALKLAKLDSRTMPRDPETWFAALHFSLPPRGARSYSWKELGDDYLSSIKESTAMTPEMETLAASVTDKDPDTLATRFLVLLRTRIRYHSDVDKLHAFVPRPAGQVLSKGYGDCKEMSTLMALLLRKKGVHAGMALVSPPGTFQVREAYPTLGGFNHMVVWIETPGKPVRFFDPTVKYGDPNDSYFPILDRTALLLESGKSRLTKVSAAKGFRNQVSTNSAIVKDVSGKDWRLEGNIRLEGLCAFNLFPMLESARGDENIPFLKEYLKEAFGVQATRCRASSNPDQSSIAIDYGASFTSNYLALDKGGLLVNQPSIYGGEVRYTTLDLEGPRHFEPLEQSDAWQVPAGFGEFKADGLDHDIGNGKWKCDGTTLKRSYANRSVEVGAAERSRAAEFVQRKTRFARATLWHK